MRRSLPLLFVLLASCGQAQPKGVKDAWVSLPAVAGNPGAAYFTLTGGPNGARLMAVSSPRVIKIELHSSQMTGKMMTMAPLETGVAVPANGEVRFSPGGMHAMLFDVDPKLRPGAKLPLRFSFGDGTTLDADAEVKAAGDMAGHDH